MILDCSVDDLCSHACARTGGEPCDATEPGLQGFCEWKVNRPGPLIAVVTRPKQARKTCPMRTSIRSLLLLTVIIAVALASYRFGVDRTRERQFTRLNTGTLASNGVRARIRVIASDTLEPVSGAIFETILIGPDGGDGGFHGYTTDENGALLTTQYLHPGRYQIYIRPPKGSRYAVTQFHEPETYLVVRGDGSYSPTEFRMLVNEPPD